MDWIKVEDRLPRLGERVIFCNDCFVGEGYLGAGNEWYRNTGCKLKFLLHGEVVAWMPFPEVTL